MQCRIRLRPTSPEPLATPLGQSAERERSNRFGVCSAPAARKMRLPRNVMSLPRQRQATPVVRERSASTRTTWHSSSRVAPKSRIAGSKQIRALSFLQSMTQRNP